MKKTSANAANAKALSLCWHSNKFGAVKAKATPLTVRRCPPRVHQALKRSAKAHHRSLNGETLVWLEKQAASEPIVTGTEAAAILRRFQKLTTPAERRQMADAIEEARQRMNREHLH